LGALLTKTSVPGRANLNAGGTEQITKNTKPKGTSTKKASVNQNTDTKPPGEKEREASKPRRSNKLKATSKKDNAVAEDFFTMDVSDVVLPLSEHDNNTSQADVSTVLCDEFLDSKPPGQKIKKATKPRRSNKPKATSKDNNAVVEDLFTMDVSEIVLPLSEHDNTTHRKMMYLLCYMMNFSMQRKQQY
jgi:hypothetical protein